MKSKPRNTEVTYLPCRTKETIRKDLESVKRKLKVMIHPVNYQKVLLWADKASEKVFHQVKKSQIN